MSTDLSHTFEAQLRAMRHELLARLQERRGGTRGRADAAAEVRDTAIEKHLRADEAFDLGVVLEEREVAELLAIDQALQRIADGSYGLCVECGVPMPTARLHAQPTALRCVACQTRAE